MTRSARILHTLPPPDGTGKNAERRTPGIHRTVPSSVRKTGTESRSYERIPASEYNFFNGTE